MTTTDRPTSTFLDLPSALTDAAIPAVPDWLAHARAAVESAVQDTLAIPESALTKVWLFRGVDTEDGVRYGLYRAAETIEAASSELEAALAGAPARPAATLRSAPATISRWKLHGRLASLDDDILDRVPKPGEWTVRQTLAHTIEGQRSYGAFSRWWLSQPLGEGRPATVSDDAAATVDAGMPKPETEGDGTVAEIRARLDACLDEWALRFATLGPDALAASARWAGVPVDIDFRLGRWASHIDEHTIQLDKTLDWLGYQPSEPARIVRTMLEAWGRLEARVFPVAPAGTEARIAPILDAMSAAITADSRSVRAAAES